LTLTAKVKLTDIAAHPPLDDSVCDLHRFGLSGDLTGVDVRVLSVIEVRDFNLLFQV
jgi:hypothetical protein